MIISLLLGKQIAAMLLMVLMGYAVVRLRLLRAEDSAPLSAVALYIVGPCMMLDAFQVDFSGEKLQGLFLSLAAAALSQSLAIVFNMLVRRPLRLDPVEQASAIYSNGGNLIIPIVIYVFGPEWVLYTSGFRYFVSNDTTPYTEVNDTYVRQNRLMVTGENMQHKSSMLAGMFDTNAVLELSTRGSVPTG